MVIAAVSGIFILLLIAAAIVGVCCFFILWRKQKRKKVDVHMRSLIIKSAISLSHDYSLSVVRGD